MNSDSRRDTPRILTRTATLPEGKRIAVMAPHPDDFDVIAVTLRRFAAARAVIEVAVMTSGASGVDDAPNLDRAAKGALREAEQSRSCVRFGLSRERLHFLRLDDDTAGHLAESAVNEERIRARLLDARPDLVFLPHPNDPNLAHQRTYAMVRRVLEREQPSTTLFLNRDPKTIDMRSDVLVLFEADEAEWKRSLLLCHESQQRRNLRTRGRGFDDRILSFNAATAQSHSRLGAFAEEFELQTTSGDAPREWQW